MQLSHVLSAYGLGGNTCPRFDSAVVHSAPRAETTAALHQMSAANDHAKAVSVLVNSSAPFGPPDPDGDIGSATGTGTGGNGAQPTTVASIGHLDDVHRCQNACFGVMPGHPTVPPAGWKPTRYVRLPGPPGSKNDKQLPGHTIDNVPGGLGNQSMVGPHSTVCGGGALACPGFVVRW